MFTRELLLRRRGMRGVGGIRAAAQPQHALRGEGGCEPRPREPALLGLPTPIGTLYQGAFAFDTFCTRHFRFSSQVFAWLAGTIAAAEPPPHLTLPSTFPLPLQGLTSRSGRSSLATRRSSSRSGTSTHRTRRTPPFHKLPFGLLLDALVPRSVEGNCPPGRVAGELLLTALSALRAA